MNRRIGERRLKPRFEVVGGELWGRLETTAALFMRNVGLGGALVHSGLALPTGSRQLVQAEIEGQVEQLSVRVTRCERTADRSGGFDIGIEFLDLSPRMRAFVDDWVASGGLAEPTA